MSKPSFTAQLRAIDDADLDPYQFRMLMHFWRVGKCFESLRTTAEKCGMSLGKASQVKQWLLDNGWIEHIAYGPKIAVQLCSLHEQRSPDEQECSPDEQIQQENVHDMNAILNEPFILNEPLLNEGSSVSRLYRVFLEETGFDPPSDPTTRERKWDRPLLAIYEKAGSDYQKTQDAIEAGVRLLVKKKYTISSPKSIQSAAVNWLNGVEEQKPEDAAVIAAWDEVKAQAVNGNKPHFSDNRILEAVRPIWPEIKNMTDFNEREVRTKFERSYANAVS